MNIQFPDKTLIIPGLVGSTLFLKHWLKSQLVGLGLAALTCWLPTGQLMAQTFNTLHNFDNLDGGNVIGGLAISSNSTLFGTTYGGGWGAGVLYAVNTDGTGFTNLDFLVSAEETPEGSMGGLVLSGTTLFGTTTAGGLWQYGTVFEVNTDGTDFEVLYSFTTPSFPDNINSDGASPQAGVILSNDMLFGTAPGGGNSGYGTVFALNTNSWDFTTLYSFTGGTDGGFPMARLTLSSNTLYGTTEGQGFWGATVFALNADGTGFRTLHNFSLRSDGTALPQAGLILSGNALFGTWAGGGGSSNGTVFSINTDGTGFTNLHTFTASSTNSSGVYTNSDGANPYAGLILSFDTLYGTAAGGGTSGVGTVFAIKTNGTGFTTLHSFTGTNGAVPWGELTLLSNTLYGTTDAGGKFGDGTVFSITFPEPQLTIRRNDESVILTWPAGFAGFSYGGFTLQSTTNLCSPVWTTTLPAPVVFDGQFTVTNPISGSQEFFRLSQ